MRAWMGGAVVATAAALSYAASAAEITGAGASFPAPIYAKWAEAYHKATGKRINYQSIGSAGGIRQIQAGTIDFGASDAPLEPEDLDKHGLIQFPTVVGGVVPVVNVKGIGPGQLRLTGQVLADIYLGKIVRWNDPAIVALNPSVQLPDQAIGVVRRADGSGTTFIFTNYLSKVNVQWKQKVGEGTAVNWPTGLGGKGNEGVAAFVQRVPGAIGYVEYAYAKHNKLAHVSLRNADGEFVQPSDVSFAAAAAGADWSRSAFYEILTQKPGKAAWPITGATFILIPRASGKPQQLAEVLRFFDWAYRRGDRLALDLDYVPVPDSVVAHVQAAWSRQLRDASGNALWAAAK